MPGRYLVFLCCLLVGGALYGCGGGDDSGNSADEKRLQQEQIEQAERKARLEERQRQQTRELQREVARLKRANRRKRSAARARGASPAPAAAPVSPSGSRSCGGGLFVGPNTSCPFAQNVREAYAGSSGGNMTVSAYSPATNRNFSMYCSGGSPHVCTGGNNASVYFP